MKEIAFAWSGFPEYAARCIRGVIDRYPGKVSVIGTRPSFPIDGVEQILGRTLNWVDGQNKDLRWEDLQLDPPALFFQGGYHLPAFRALGAECRAFGSAVIGQSDAPWRGTWRQALVDTVRHRLFLRRRFDGWFVPGQAGLRHARIMGYPPSNTKAGVLGADPALFNGGRLLSQRPRTLLFVGQLDSNKNVLGLVKAFHRFVNDYPNWHLQICGTGPEMAHILEHPNIDVAGFVPPAELVHKFRESRCLVLPSTREAWGLVVHEATLCGCALALSSSVGAIDDLARPQNSVIFGPGSETEIEISLRKLANWDDGRWDEAETVSRELSHQFGPETFADAVDQFISIFDP